MRKFGILLFCTLALMFCFPGVAYAQEGETLPDPGITPDSLFYFADKWGEQISLMFTFKAENKVPKALRYADERLAEIDAMIAKNKIKAATRATNGYQTCLETATQNMEQARLKGGDVSEAVVLMSEKHLGFLGNSAGDIPEDARAVLTQTRERAMISQETALKSMAKGNPEKAAQFNLKLMERQLNRIRVQAEEPETEGLQERLQEYNRLGNLGEEISQIAKGLGEETTVDQLVGQATAHHLEVLAETRQRVQGQAQQEVDDAIQKRIQNHETVVTRLQAQKQLGEVPEETPIPEEIPENVKQEMSAGRSGQKPSLKTEERFIP
ncbi:DUF5667 domain-containing protein [Chloroflexota bacterium]